MSVRGGRERSGERRSSPERVRGRCHILHNRYNVWSPVAHEIVQVEIVAGPVYACAAAPSSPANSASLLISLELSKRGEANSPPHPQQIIVVQLPSPLPRLLKFHLERAQLRTGFAGALPGTRRRRREHLALQPRLSAEKTYASSGCARLRRLARRGRGWGEWAGGGGVGAG